MAYQGASDGRDILLGFFFLMICCICAQLRYKLALENPYYMIVAPMILVLSQAFLISRRLQDSFQKSKHLADQLLRYDRQKDEFSVKTSHELRTPLHGIVNALNRCWIARSIRCFLSIATT